MINDITDKLNNLNGNIIHYNNNDDNIPLRMTNTENHHGKYLIVYGHDNNADYLPPEYHVNHSDRLLIYFDYSNEFNNNKFLLVIMLNPSTFSEQKSDKAVNRFIEYMKRLNTVNNYQGLFIMNICTKRRTNVKKIRDIENNSFADLNNMFFDTIINNYNPDIILGPGAEFNQLSTYNYLTRVHPIKMRLSRCFNDGIYIRNNNPNYCGNARSGCNNDLFYRPYTDLTFCRDLTLRLILDYGLYAERCNVFKEELIQKVYHPRRVMYYINLYNYDINSETNYDECHY